MRILLIDPNSHSREVLSTRVTEALRQAGVKRSEIVQVDFEQLAALEPTSVPTIGFLGPGCYQNIESNVSKFWSVLPSAPLALVLDNEVYPIAAVELRREIAVRIMPLADIVQMVQFILDHLHQTLANGGNGNRGLVTVAQLKGGVGGTTVACGIAAAWARHGLSVALVDLDDVSPQVTAWAKVPIAKKRAVSEFLQGGDVPLFRVSEMLYPLETYGRQLSIVGQPERYQESFHFKADVLDSIPSSAEFVSSLVSVLRTEFDVVIVDSGRSWGISTFALLPQSQHVLLVMDDRLTTIQRTVENLTRLYRESDDPEEFDFSRWRVVMNSYAGNAASPKKVWSEIEALDLFPKSTSLNVIPRSQEGRDWALGEQTLYEVGDSEVRTALADLAFSLVPFKRSANTPAAIASKFRQQLQRFVSLP